MGKRNLKNKYKKNKNILSAEEECPEEQPLLINETYIIMQKVKYINKTKLNSTNYNDRESITSLLSSHEFSSKEEKMRDQLVRIDFCKLLAEKLLDPFIQIRFNTVSAIINLLICYSENDIDNIFLFDVGLIKYIETILTENITNISSGVKYTEGEQIKINKLLKSVIDLLLLIIELYDSDDNKNYNKLDFDLVLKCSIEFILNPGSISEEVILSSCLFITNMLSLRVIIIQNSPHFLNYVQFAEKIIKDKLTCSKANLMVVSCLTCSLFYLYCSNSSNPLQLNEIEFLQHLIDSIYSNINFNLGQQIDDMNCEIQNYIKNIPNDDENNIRMIVDENKQKENHKSSSRLKEKIKSTEENIRATILYLKTFTDVINSVELKNQILSNKYQEDDEVDLEDEDNSEENLNNPLEIEQTISRVVNEIFKNSNYASLLKMLKFQFIPNLIKFFHKLSVEEFLINDFDKMIIIKELIYDLEYYTLSIINNIIQNYDEIFNDDSNLLFSIATSIITRLQTEEYSKNQDFLSVLLTTFRTILEKYKIVSDQILVNGVFDFKSLFVILNNNICDSFIKINIIDIVSFIFSIPHHSKGDNNEICKLLYNICINEIDMEVVAHVLNAYFDIYKEDDLESNVILKNNGVIELMKIGVEEFKSKVNISIKI